MASDKKNKLAGRKLKGNGKAKGHAKNGQRAGVRYDPKNPDYFPPRGPHGPKPPSEHHGPPPSHAGGGRPDPRPPRYPGEPGGPIVIDDPTRAPRPKPIPMPWQGGEVIIRPMPGEPGGVPFPPGRGGGPSHGRGGPHGMPPGLERMSGQLLAALQERLAAVRGRTSPNLPPGVRQGPNVPGRRY